MSLYLESVVEVWIRLRERDHLRAADHRDEQVADPIGTEKIHDQSSPNAPTMPVAFLRGNLGEIAAGHLFGIPAPLPPRGGLDLTTVGGIRIEVKATATKPPFLSSGFYHRDAQIGLLILIYNKRWAKAIGWVTTKEYYAQKVFKPGPGQRGGYDIVARPYRGIGRLLVNEAARGGQHQWLHRCPIGGCIHIISGDSNRLCPDHEKRGGQLRFL